MIIYTVGTDSMAGGTTTDIDGRFVINGLDLGEYRLEMSFLGYDTENKEVALTQVQNLVKAGAITLETAGEDLRKSS